MKQFEMFELEPAQTIFPLDDYLVPDKNDTQTPYCCDCKNWRATEKIENDYGKEEFWISGPGVCILRKKQKTKSTGYCTRWIAANVLEKAE